MFLNELWARQKEFIGKEITVHGWIRNHRPQKEFGFIDFSDGTAFKHLQIVYDAKNPNFLEIQALHNGAAILVSGVLQKSEGKNQDVELKAKTVQLLGDCPLD